MTVRIETVFLSVVSIDWTEHTPGQPLVIPEFSEEELALRAIASATKDFGPGWEDGPYPKGAETIADRKGARPWGEHIRAFRLWRPVTFTEAEWTEWKSLEKFVDPGYRDRDSATRCHFLQAKKARRKLLDENQMRQVTAALLKLGGSR